MEIIYEDNHIIVVNKRPGEIVQGDKTGDKPLSEMLKDWLKEKYAKPGNVFCGVVHRLDRPVGGVVVFAKTGKGLARMNELFRNGDVRKTYWAITKNMPPEQEGTLTHYIITRERINKSYAYDTPREGAAKAVLKYKETHDDIRWSGTQQSRRQHQPIGTTHRIRPPRIKTAHRSHRTSARRQVVANFGANRNRKRILIQPHENAKSPANGLRSRLYCILSGHIYV